jgi:hypothetical protein
VSKQLNKSNLAILVSLSLTFIFSASPQVAWADEGGNPFWISGQYAAMAAVPTTPGWSLSVMPYVYSGSASRSKSLSGGGSVNAGVTTRESMVLVQLGYSSEKKMFGGQPYIGFSWGPGSNTTSASASVFASRDTQLNRSNSVHGVQDIYPLASLAWTKGNNNFMTYLTGNIPVGTYNYSSLAAIGLGHAAIDSGVGYTYLNTNTGWEFSGVLGATYNWMNKQTNYQSGIDSHLDWSISRLLTANWQAGIAGYVYYQLTPDSGSGDRVGAFKSQISAIGPQIGYLFNINKKPAYINVRAYKEFWAQNRVEGHAVFATINIPLSR